MPIESYEGNTFVAFSDISGFKSMMKEKNRAWRALSKFYGFGYEVLDQSHHNNLNSKVEGFFMSDCCVLFVRNNTWNDTNNSLQDLETLLRTVKALNVKMLNSGYFLTTSISFGKFKYQRRIELDWIEKSAIYGSAYVEAFLDNEKGRPKLSPGLCRIIKENLPDELRLSGYLSDYIIGGKKRKHYYYYWMLSANDNIKDFKNEYKCAYKLRHESGFNELERVIKSYIAP